MGADHGVLQGTLEGVKGPKGSRDQGIKAAGVSATHGVRLGLFPFPLTHGRAQNNKHNLGEYKGLLEVDERLVGDLISAAQTVADALQGA